MSVTGKWEVRGLMVMADLDALAKRFHAFEAVDKSEFQRAASGSPERLRSFSADVGGLVEGTPSA